MTDSPAARPSAVKLRILGPYAAWSADARRGRLERPDGSAADVYLVPASPFLGTPGDSSLEDLRDAARRVAAWRDDGALHLKQVARVDGVDLLVFAGPDALRSVTGLLDGGPAPLRAALQLVSSAAATATRGIAAGLDPSPALALDRVLVAPDGTVRVVGTVPGQGTAADAAFGLGGLLLCLLLGDAGAAPQTPAQARRALIRLLSAPAGRPPDAVVDLLRAALSPEEESRPAPAGLGAALGALARGQPGMDLVAWLRDGPQVAPAAAPAAASEPAAGLAAEPVPALPQRPLGLATGPLPDMLDDPPTTDVVEVEGRGARDGGGVDEVVPAGMRQRPRRPAPVDHTAPMSDGPGRPTDGGTEPVIEEAAAEDTEEVAREDWPPAPPEKTMTSGDGVVVPSAEPVPEPRPRPPIGGGAVPAVPDHRDTAPGLGPSGPALVVGPAPAVAGPLGVGPVGVGPVGVGPVGVGPVGVGAGGSGADVRAPGDDLDAVGRTSRSGTLWAVAVVVLLLGGGAAGAWWWLGQETSPGPSDVDGAVASAQVDGAPGRSDGGTATAAPAEVISGHGGGEAGSREVASEQTAVEETAVEDTAVEDTAVEETAAPSTGDSSRGTASGADAASVATSSSPAGAGAAGRSAAPREPARQAPARGAPADEEPDLRVRIPPRAGAGGQDSRDPVLDDTRAGDAYVPPERAEPTRAVIEVSVGGDPAATGDGPGEGPGTSAAGSPTEVVVDAGPEPRPWTLTFRAGAGAAPRIEVTCHGGRTGSGAVVTIPDAVPGPCRIEGRAEPAGRLVAHVSVSGSAEYTCFTDGARSCR